MRNFVSKTTSILRRTLGEHIRDPEGIEIGIRLGITIFHKTRLNSHLSFIRTCFKEDVIPKGFQLSFHSGLSTWRILRRCSHQLMRQTLRKYGNSLKQLDAKKKGYSNQLHQSIEVEQRRKISAFIHEINAELYMTCLAHKESKLSQLGVNDSKNKLSEQESTDKAVICIPNTVELSSTEKRALSKGLNFIPTQKRDVYRTEADVQHFIRKVKLRAHFHTPDTGVNTQTTEQDEFLKYKKKHSTFTPEAGQYDAVDTFVTSCNNQVRALIKEPEKVKKSNLTREEERALKGLRRRKDIYINKADKGGAIVVWERTKYFAEGHKQLHDTKFYQPLNKDITAENQKTVKKTLRKLIDDNKLPETSMNLLIDNPVVSRLYLLAKIHKKDVPGRPIISNVNCPTYQISKYLSEVLCPITEKQPTYIRDTKDLLHQIEDLELTGAHPPLLFTMDVKSLYTNIPNNEALIAVKFFLQELNIQVDHTAIIKLVELVLTVNCFTFDGMYYKQIGGMMMGTPFAVAAANIHQSWCEIMIKKSYNGAYPEFFRRYIDDNIGATCMGRDDLEEFITFTNNHNQAIKYTWEISDTSVAMLDTTLYVKENKILSTIHYKPTDSHAYLTYSSQHPKSCKKSIPYSQLIRLKRNISEDTIYEEESKKMGEFFIKRGYPKSLINESLLKAARLKRKDLLKPQKNKEDQDCFSLPITYNAFNINIVRILLKHYKTLQEDPLIGQAFTTKPTVAYRRGRNIKQCVVQTDITTDRDNVAQGTFPCDSNRCLTCHHTNSDQIITGPSGWVRPEHRFDCNSANIVYVISCDKCGQIYVGETGRKLKERFREHRRHVNILLEQPNSIPKSEVAKHFAEGGHSSEDMRVAAIHRVVNRTERQLKEQRLIGKLGAYRGEAMNVDFHYLNIVQN